MAALAENIDLGGRTLTVFARDVMQAALTDGLTHILVDYPRIGETGKDTARPYLVHIRAPDLIGWRGQESGIGSSLTRIRIRETVHRASGTWDDTTECQIRVLYPDSF